MSEGDIDGDEIYCPFHMGAFDIRTGEATVPPCVTPLKTYQTEVVDQMVSILLEKA